MSDADKLLIERAVESHKLGSCPWYLYEWLAVVAPSIHAELED